MTKVLILFNMALLLRTKCTRTWISRPPSGNGDNLGVILSTNWSSLMKEIKYKSWKFSSYMSNCDITNSIYTFDHNFATIWLGINWYAVGFFQNFNLLVQRYISSSFSRCTWYPRLPISVVKELMAIFKSDKILMVIDYLIFPFRKKTWLNMSLLYFSFLLYFRIFRMFYL